MDTFTGGGNSSGGNGGGNSGSGNSSGGNSSGGNSGGGGAQGAPLQIPAIILQQGTDLQTEYNAVVSDVTSACGGTNGVTQVDPAPGTDIKVIRLTSCPVGRALSLTGTPTGPPIIIARRTIRAHRAAARPALSQARHYDRRPGRQASPAPEHCPGRQAGIRDRQGNQRRHTNTSPGSRASARP